ncbi:MAG TPA: hypothetical protein VGM37_10365 [Armatimonadota bacterium]
MRFRCLLTPSEVPRAAPLSEWRRRGELKDMLETSEHRVLYVCIGSAEAPSALLSVLEMQGFRVTAISPAPESPMPSPSAFSAVIVDAGERAENPEAFLLTALAAAVPAILISPADEHRRIADLAGAVFLRKPVDWQVLVLKLLRLGPASRGGIQYPREPSGPWAPS